MRRYDLLLRRNRPEPLLGIGQPQLPAAWAAAARRHGHRGLPGSQIAVAVADAAPPALRQAEHRLALRPLAQHDEGAPAPPDPRVQPRDSGIAGSLRRTNGHDGQDISQGRNDRQPMLAGMRHQRQPVECDPLGGGRLHPELGNAHHAAP